jgi:hypothetical protein
MMQSPTLAAIHATGSVKAIKKYREWLGPELMKKLDGYNVGYGEYDHEEDEDEDGDPISFDKYSIFVPDPRNFGQVYDLLNVMSPGMDYIRSEYGEYREDRDFDYIVVGPNSITNTIGRSGTGLVEISSGTSNSLYVNSKGREVKRNKTSIYFATPFRLDVGNFGNFPFDSFYLHDEDGYIELGTINESMIKYQAMEHDSLPVHYQKNFANAAHVRFFFIYMDLDGESISPSNFDRNNGMILRIQITTKNEYYSYTTEKKKNMKKRIENNIFYYADPKYVPAIKVIRIEKGSATETLIEPVATTQGYSYHVAKLDFS